MRLTIVNISKQISSADFRNVISAVRRQVNEDFQPEWGIAATIRGTTRAIARGMAPVEGKHDAILYVGDSSQDPTTGVTGALGYHTENHRTVPYGFVYLDVCAEYGEEWSTTLSHEVLELLADPTAAMTVTGPAPHGAGSAYFDLEVCDPTQGDSYSIDGITVSNFVGKSYFHLPGGSGDTNFLRLELQPLSVRPRGYFQYEDRAGVHQIQGEKVSDRHTAARKLMGNARRNFRRSARIAS